MKLRAPLAVTMICLATASCESEPEVLPPLGYHLLTIDTDALVPAGLSAEVDPAARAPLFDSLEITVLFEGETVPRPENIRQTPINADTFSAEGSGASFTITREPSLADSVEGETPAAFGARPRVRARLYRLDASYEGRVREETAIDVWAQLPPTPETGAIETTIYLLTDDVGTTKGSAEAPLGPSDAPEARVRPGRPESTLVGTWPGAVEVDCSTDDREGRICVPGGAYWMGNPIVKGTDFVESDRQRLVVLSPFYLDTKEVTVGDFRSWVAANPSGPVDVTAQSPDPADAAHFCTFTPEAGDGDDRPVNCVSWATAQSYCQDQGSKLPTEAQFEYASGALRSALYVWGTDQAAICEAAVWGRGGRSGTAIAGVGSDKCLPPAEVDGPLPLTDATIKASRITDKVELRGGLVFDLAGNLQEWQSDYFSAQDGPCWKRTDAKSNVFVDPNCTDQGVDGDRSVRGGSWIQNRDFLRAAYRTRASAGNATRYDVGFRCAQSDD